MTENAIEDIKEKENDEVIAVVVEERKKWRSKLSRLSKIVM